MMKQIPDVLSWKRNLLLRSQNWWTLGTPTSSLAWQKGPGRHWLFLHRKYLAETPLCPAMRGTGRQVVSFSAGTLFFCSGASGQCCVCDPGVQRELYTKAQPLLGRSRRLPAGCLQRRAEGGKTAMTVRYDQKSKREIIIISPHIGQTALWNISNLLKNLSHFSIKYGTLTSTTFPYD